MTNHSQRTNSRNKVIFIVEDNDVYAKTLQAYIHTRFPSVTEIETFRIGEMCLMELHRNPGIVIMDYFLNSKYEEAHNGLEIIKRIKAQKPLTNIIVLSDHENINDISEGIKEFGCRYVQKDEEAFGKVEQHIKEILDRKNSHTLEPWS